MATLQGFLPKTALIAFMAVGCLTGFSVAVMRPLTLALFIISGAILAPLWRQGRVSPIDQAFVIYFFIAALSYWTWPHGWGWAVGVAPGSWLYLVLFFTAVLPPLFGREPFTCFFAKKNTPPEVWETDIFLIINRHLTWWWSFLFLVCLILGLVPLWFGWSGLRSNLTFNIILPGLILLGPGRLANKRYPAHYQKKIGLEPV